MLYDNHIITKVSSICNQHYVPKPEISIKYRLYIEFKTDYFFFIKFFCHRILRLKKSYINLNAPSPWIWIIFYAPDRSRVKRSELHADGPGQPCRVSSARRKKRGSPFQENGFIELQSFLNLIETV